MNYYLIRDMRTGRYKNYITKTLNKAIKEATFYPQYEINYNEVVKFTISNKKTDMVIYDYKGKKSLLKPLYDDKFSEIFLSFDKVIISGDDLQYRGLELIYRDLHINNFFESKG